MEAAIEKSAMRKIYLRLLPFAIFTYFLAYIDRINVSFAGLTMRGDLDMSATAFGFAAGTFYWGYFIFEVPSNVIMEKVGARLWIARIMITWGIFAGLTALVTGPTSFSVVRFLLGAAEAGFFPGIVLYFTYWFPAHHHGAHRLGLPDRPADRGGRRRTDLHRTSQPRRRVGPARLAMDVYRRGDPDHPDRRRHILRPHRQAGAGDVSSPPRRRPGSARSCSPSAGPRRRCGPSACGRACSTRRCCCWR